MIKILFSIISCILFLIVTFAEIYFTIKYTSKKARKENMSKIDFAREKDYYREILKEYSPAELSYIDDFKVEIPREIVATILNLKLKRKIEINKNEIKVIDSEIEGLRKTEKFVLQNIVDGKVQIDNSGYIESYAQDEAIKDELIKKNSELEGRKRNKKMLIKIGLTLIILIILFIIICNNAEKINELNNNVISTILTILTFIYSIILFMSLTIMPIAMIVYSLLQINSYSRTEKGEEVNRKIEGLKQYITDYSLLKEKEQNELILWEEYLIYSVIFGLNKTSIVDEISKLIEINFQYGKIYFEKY